MQVIQFVRMTIKTIINQLPSVQFSYNTSVHGPPEAAPKIEIGQSKSR